MVKKRYGAKKTRPDRCGKRYRDKQFKKRIHECRNAAKVPK